VTSGNRGQATRYVVARDTTPPVVTLVGPELYVVEGGEPYTPPLYGNPGVQAHDLVDDDWYFTMMNRITITLEHVALGSSGFSGDPANYSDITSGNQAQHTYLAGKSVSQSVYIGERSGVLFKLLSRDIHAIFSSFRS
jgi:hypothetical protein